jgi:hypothetical protein
MINSFLILFSKDEIDDEIVQFGTSIKTKECVIYTVVVIVIVDVCV